MTWQEELLTQNALGAFEPCILGQLHDNMEVNAAIRVLLPEDNHQ